MLRLKLALIMATIMVVSLVIAVQLNDLVFAWTAGSFGALLSTVAGKRFDG